MQDAGGHDSDISDDFNFDDDDASEISIDISTDGPEPGDSSHQRTGAIAHPTWAAPDWDKLWSQDNLEGQATLGEDESKFYFDIYGEAYALVAGNDGISGPRFRLLQIEPGTPDQPVHCQLVNRPLYDAPEYTALSYAWGAGPQSEHVLLGSTNTPFSVSTHLLAALLRLRKQRQRMFVWVDAICINQQNLIERAMQVQIMEQIYNQASEVVIWLGAKEDLDLENISDDELFWLLCHEEHAWWRRTWIVQECAYASKCPRVMLGDMSLSLEALVARWAAVLSPRIGGEISIRSERLRENFEFLYMPYNAWKSQVDTGTHRLSLLQRLKETAKRECTVPHDAIYAILSLVDEAEASRIVPDYRKPYVEVQDEVKLILQGDPAWRDGDDLYISGRPPRRGITADEVIGHLEHASSVGSIEWTVRFLACLPHQNRESLIARWIFIEAKAGNTLIVKLLLDNLTDATKLSDHDILNAALSSPARSPKELVLLLLESGADPKESEALHVAARKGHEEIVKCLVEHGADVDAVTQPGDETPIQLASSHGHLQVVRTLLKLGANIKLCGKAFGAALHAAAAEGHEEIVQLLVDQGADVNALTEPGRAHRLTPLQTASSGGHLQVVRALLDRGADVDACGSSYETALQIAAAKGHEKIVQVLLDHGADGNRPCLYILI